MAGLFDFLSNNAGALVGGLLGASGSGNTQKSTTDNKEPWAAAQPYMLKNLENEADLQKYYQKTPFNAQQIQGYSNLNNDIGNFRDNVMPGLMDFANKGMTSSYTRQKGGEVGSGGGYGGAVQPGGLLQSGTGPFSVAKSASPTPTGLLDLNGAQNPFANGSIKTPEAKAQEYYQTTGLLGTGGSGGHNASTTPSNLTDRQWEEVKAMRDAIDPTTGEPYGMSNTWDKQQLQNITNLLAMGVGMSDIGTLMNNNSSSMMSLNSAIAAKDGVTPTYNSPVGYDPSTGNFTYYNNGGGSGGGNGATTGGVGTSVGAAGSSTSNYGSRQGFNGATSYGSSND